MIIVRTPLRISFVGGGSDVKSYYQHHQGQVVCTAIDKFVYAIVKQRFDEMIYINYSRKETVNRVDQIRHDLVREAMKITGIDSGIEITTLADIPSSGSGLGSSSSITVALLHALYAYRNTLVTAEQLAKEACQIEIDILGKPIGRQDQYAAAFGGVNRLIFNSDDTTQRIAVPMNSAYKRRFASSLLLYYTGITRKADTILSRQKANMETENKRENLRAMVALVEPFTRAMERGDIQACAELLDRNWQLKQRLASGISNPDIEKMYGHAKRAGALAGKICGAGGGGFLLLLASRENQNRVFEAMQDYREMPFMIEDSGSKVIFDDRSYSSK
ncbi:MAG: GHMP kinase [Desulfobacteraceae bacterium]|jgi:D-glycero-alpha-D-manno-heptose-7-phosphate kinase